MTYRPVMGRTRKTRSYWEPWRAEPSALWQLAFGDPPPVDDADVLARWAQARDRAEENAEWVIWGSKMFEPLVAHAPVSGEPVVMDDRHAVVRFTRCHTDNPDPPTHGEIATRVAECVNALAGVGDPVALINATRELLYELSTGRTDADDDRVVSLLARWIPATTISMKIVPEP